MKELCIPVPNFGEDQIAEVQLTVGGKKMGYHFRVESFPWTSDSDNSGNDSFERISRLKQAIADYDRNWELIQIFTPAENAQYIQVLYRRREVEQLIA